MASYAKKLAFGSMLGVVNHIASIVVAIFLMPFVVYSLGDRMYGFWTLVSMFIGYYGLLDFGMSSAVSRFIAAALGAGQKRECERIVSTAFVIYSGMGLAALLISVALALLDSVLFPDPAEAFLFRNVILVLGLNVAIGFPVKVYKGILHAQLRFEIVALLRFITLVLRSLLVVIVLLKGYRILALAWVTLLACLPEYVLAVYFARRSLPGVRVGSGGWERGATRALFSYSVHTFVARIADEMRFNIDGLVISAFIGLSAVTHYRVASVLVNHFIMLILTAMGVLLPFFSRLDGEENNAKIRETLFLSTKISVILTSFVGFGLIAWGKPFIERWMGAQYLDAYPCLVVLVMGSVFDLWQAPTVGLLYATARHRFYSFYNCLEAVCNLLLSLVLVRKYGILGVAVGTFIPMAVMKLLIQPVYTCRVSNIDYKEYIKGLCRTLGVVSMALVIPILITVGFSAPDYLRLTGIGILSMMSFLSVLWKFEFHPSEKKRLIHVLSFHALFRKIVA